MKEIHFMKMKKNTKMSGQINIECKNCMWEGSAEELLPFNILNSQKQVCPDCGLSENLFKLEEYEEWF
jgi:hypothetical protein